MFAHCDTAFSFRLLIFLNLKLRVKSAVVSIEQGLFERKDQLSKEKNEEKEIATIFTAAERDTGPAISFIDKTKQAIGHRCRSQQGAMAFLSTKCCRSPCLYFHCSRSDLRHVVPRGDIILHLKVLSERPRTIASQNERRALE